MEFNATFIVSAISFIFFTLIMNAILYEPLKEIMKKRQDYLDANESAANECIKSANAITAEKESKLSESRTNAKSMILREMENSKKNKSAEEAIKKQEMADKLATSKDELKSEKERLSGELNNQAHEISNSIYKKIIGEEVQNG